MKEELTTEMHAEFAISKESEKQLSALSLLQMERDGIDISDRIEMYGFTDEEFAGMRKYWAHLFTK